VALLTAETRISPAFDRHREYGFDSSHRVLIAKIDLQAICSRESNRFDVRRAENTGSTQRADAGVKQFLTGRRGHRSYYPR